MPWIQLSLRCRADDQPRVEDALERQGAVSVTLLDAEDVPILEPGAGETPLWPELIVQALFEDDIDVGATVAGLSKSLGVSPDAIAHAEVADSDWERAWMDQYRPMRFGRRLWIYPWNVEPPDDADGERVVVRLDPGLAFGTGTHPTTALCLSWLDGLCLAGARVLDLGCGSGVLAIAALKLGAVSAVGIDNDPQALVASRDNAVRNGVGDALALYAPEDAPQQTYPVVVANILANTLDALAPTLAARTAPGGRIALSGILAGQETALLARYRAWFDELAVARQEDWIRIDGRRREA